MEFGDLKEICFEESKKYTCRWLFQRGSKKYYQISRINGWLDEMTWLVDPRIKWSKEKTFKESKKYKSRGEFSKKCNGAYDMALRKGWLDEMTWLSNQKIYGENAKKIDNVYVYEFTQFKSVYIGRTVNIDKRDYQHRYSKTITRNGNIREYKDTVFEFAKEHNIDIPEPKILETNITILEGRELEGICVERYKEQGWNILNKHKCGKNSGSLGTMSIKWTKSKVFEESKKYTYRYEFQQGCMSAYYVACKNGWLDEMTWLQRPEAHNKKWKYETCIEESKKYKSRGEFIKNNKHAYDISRKNGWLDEMTWLTKTEHPQGYWTKETATKEIKKYKSRTDLAKHNNHLYIKSLKNGWLDEIFPKTPKSY